MKKNLSLALILMLTSLAGAQNIAVVLKDGSGLSKVLNTVQKITFSDGNLLMTYNSATSDSYGVATINKIVFTDVSSSVSADTWQPLSVWFDKLTNRIYIENMIQTEAIVSIYQINGSKIKNDVVTPDAAYVDAADLGPGIYLVNINNQSFKIIR